MKKSELQQIIREEIKNINEAYTLTIAGVADEYPDVTVLVKDDGSIIISQEINGRTSKVLLSKRQFAKLKEA